jgi:hypothetical protein
MVKDKNATMPNNESGSRNDTWNIKPESINVKYPSFSLSFCTWDNPISTFILGVFDSILIYHLIK